MKKLMWYLLVNSVFLQGANVEDVKCSNAIFLQIIERYRTEQKVDKAVDTTSHAQGETKMRQAAIAAYFEHTLQECSELPDKVRTLIGGYAMPGWSLVAKTKIHNGIPLRIGAISNTLAASYASELASGIYDNKLWNIQTGTIQGSDIGRINLVSRVAPVAIGSKTRCRSMTQLAGARQGRWLVASDVSKGLLVWEVGDLSYTLEVAEARGLVRRIQKKNAAEQPSLEHAFSSIAIPLSEQHIIAGGFDGTVAILDAKNHQALYTFDHEESVTAVAITPDECTLLVGLADGTMVTWSKDEQDQKLDDQAIAHAVPAQDQHDAPAAMFMSDTLPAQPIKACYQNARVFCSLCHQCASTCLGCCKQECALLFRCFSVAGSCCCNGPRYCSASWGNRLQ